MNTRPRIETIALNKIVALALAICPPSVALLGAFAVCFAQTPSPTSRPPSDEDGRQQVTTAAPQLMQSELSSKIPREQLESLVAPIALYPDPVLVQTLAASTYPLEIVRLKQWLIKNKNLKDKALAEAVAQQNWDPSVQALSAFPAVVDKLANDIQWTTDLGDAFLAQESDLMDSVQDLRARAQANGALKSNDKQIVGSEETNDGKRAITIESAQREVVYVPSYNTQIVYRDSGSSKDSGYSSSDYSRYSSDSGYSDAGYSYLGYAVGAAYGYYWGRYSWRDGYAKVNENNYYVKNYNAKWNNNYSKNISNRNEWNEYARRFNEGSSRWQHDPTHRGNVPYGNSNLANRVGQANNRLANSQLTNRVSQLAKTSAPTQAVRGNFTRAPGGAKSGVRPPNSGAVNRIGNRMPTNSLGGARGGAFSAPRGDFARASSLRGGESLRLLGGFHGGPPSAFHGGLPPSLHGGPPMGGPPIGGGMSMGAPPPPPPPVP
jgi:Protein of unknown function (DUF3300)